MGVEDAESESLLLASRSRWRRKGPVLPGWRWRRFGSGSGFGSGFGPLY